MTTLPTNSALILSLLTSLGGIIGFARTGSIPSIAAGVSVGALYLYSFARLRSGQAYGEELGLLASIVLGGSSVPRAIKTRKAVPVALSLVAAYGLLVFGAAVKGVRRGLEHFVPLIGWLVRFGGIEGREVPTGWVR